MKLGSYEVWYELEIINLSSIWHFVCNAATQSYMFLNYFLSQCAVTARIGSCSFHFEIIKTCGQAYIFIQWKQCFSASQPPTYTLHLNLTGCKMQKLKYDCELVILDVIFGFSILKCTRKKQLTWVLKLRLGPQSRHKDLRESLMDLIIYCWLKIIIVL